MRPYKAAPPQDTIQRIRTILHDLRLFITEQHFRNESMHYSCRVRIDNRTLAPLDIGTNGKGMDAVYSLASGYAELMERIQNKMIIYATKYASEVFRKNNPALDRDFIPTLGFRYFADEEWCQITPCELWEECCRYAPNAVRKSSPRSLEAERYNMYYCEYYNATKNIVERLPYHLLRLSASSTGLCAGNSPAEAMVQGLNEIFERYVLQQIYLRRITPPAIPLEVFEGTDISRRLRRLEKEKNLYVEVKDCSLGEGFPVVGLLLVDRRSNRYAFRLGADMSPEIALQRCFTEAFQGIGTDGNYSQPVHLADDWDVREEHNRSIVNGQGKYPREIFLRNPSYPFRGFELKAGDSHKDDLRILREWLSVKGYTLYVRDNSFLGFPAYHLYVPRLSEIDGDLFNLLEEIERSNSAFFTVKPEYRLRSLTVDETRHLISKYKDSKELAVTLFPYNSSAYNRINRCLLLSMLSYKVGDDAGAFQFMDTYLRQKRSAGHALPPYYHCVRDYYYAKTVCRSDADILSMLEVIYSPEMVKEVVCDMEDRGKVLDNMPLPDCFNCDKCKIRPACHYNEILQMEKTIQKCQQANIKNQSDLCHVFY